MLARKGFHLVAVLLFAPVADASLLGLAYAVALSLLLLLEVARATGGPLRALIEEAEKAEEASGGAGGTTAAASGGAASDSQRAVAAAAFASSSRQLWRRRRWPLGAGFGRVALRRYYARFVDGREATEHAGAAPKLVLTPLYLLLGCALPHWLAHAALLLPTSPHAEATACRANFPAVAVGAAADDAAGADAYFLLRRAQAAVGLVALSGVLCLGVGDAVAAAVGTRWGRTKWPWQRPGQKRSLEGSAAALAAMLCAAALVLAFRFPQGPGDPVAQSSPEGAFREPPVPASGATAASAPSLVLQLLPSLVLPLALTCILEAYATAIDNLVLPLYGAALLATALL